MIISILTGLAAGAVHVVSGPDHLLSIAPTAFRDPRLAIRNAFAWGFGHSAGVVLLCGIAISFKDLVNIQRLSSFAELSVGIVLLVLGASAIKSSLGLNIHSHKHNHGSNKPHEHLHLHLRGHKKHLSHSHAVTSLGVLHGFAGASHLLGVIPALALPPTDAFVYMLFYLLGSVMAMVLMVFAMALTTLKAGKKALPFLMATTGSLSILTGFFWIQKTSILLV